MGWTDSATGNSDLRKPNDDINSNSANTKTAIKRGPHTYQVDAASILIPETHLQLHSVQERMVSIEELVGVVRDGVAELQSKKVIPEKNSTRLLNVARDLQKWDMEQLLESMRDERERREKRRRKDELTENAIRDGRERSPPGSKSPASQASASQSDSEDDQPHVDSPTRAERRQTGSNIEAGNSDSTDGSDRRDSPPPPRRRRHSSSDGSAHSPPPRKKKRDGSDNSHCSTSPRRMKRSDSQEEDGFSHSDRSQD